MNKEKLEARREAKKQARELARIESEKNQRPVKAITITIEWKRSQTWGSNPNCEAQIEYKESDGMNGRFERSPIYKCSGCGYDKESTVIADVFNSYLKYKLYQPLKEIPNMWLNGKPTKIPYGISINEQHRHYSGGIGTDCYYKISEAIGGKFEHISSGKTFDVYKYTDNE